ncbi:MAG: serine/threonine-protein kinase [Planctomycetota bacterium]
MTTGDKAGEYILGTVLGVGTVGTVFRAVHQKSGEAVAVKVLLPQVQKDEDIKARFYREIEILERLSHPNIVEFKGTGRDGDNIYYLMELVEGGTLKDILKKKVRLEWQDAIEVGWQVCSALQHLHNNGVIHRDLKPANLFISDDGKVKLGDFGIALDVAASGLTDAGLTVGTYMYMSPEQIRGEGTIGPETDLYAFGCLLHEMLTGRPPFEGENFARIFDQHLTATAPPVTIYYPSIPDELGDIVEKLLAKSPEDRPFNARAVQGMLAEVLIEWDERQSDSDLKIKKRKTPDIWAVEPNRKPILADLVRQSREPEYTGVTWKRVAIAGGVTVALLVLGVLASRKPGTGGDRPATTEAAPADTE